MSRVSCDFGLDETETCRVRGDEVGGGVVEAHDEFVRAVRAEIGDAHGRRQAEHRVGEPSVDPDLRSPARQLESQDVAPAVEGEDVLDRSPVVRPARRGEIAQGERTRRLEPAVLEDEVALEVDHVALGVQRKRVRPCMAESGRFAGEGVDVAVDEVRREAQGGRAPGDGGFIERRVGRRVVGGVGGGVGVGSGVGEEHLLLAQVGAELLHLHAGVAARVAVLVVEPDREAEALGAVAGVEDEFEPAFGEVGDPVAFAGVQDDAAASAGLHGLELLGDAGFLLDAVPEPEGIDAGLGKVEVSGGHGSGQGSM